MSENKDIYKTLATENNTNLNIFIRPWWLDCVCGDSWDVFLYKKHDKIYAAFPYRIVRKSIFKLIVPPELTPVCGCWIDYSDCKNLSERYSLENAATESFASFCNSIHLDAFCYTLNPEFFCSMGFYWNNFSTSLHYTYRINIEQPEDTFKHFRKSLRKDIRDMGNIMTFTDRDINLNEAYNLLKQTYHRQNNSIPYSEELFKNIVTSSVSHKQGKIFAAKDVNKNTCGIIFIVWDSNICYNLIGGITDNVLSNSVMAFMTWNAMLYANSLGLKIFDMEGSMLKGVEHHFRLYGGERTPYLVITKQYSRLYSLLKTIKSKLNKH